MNQCRRKTSTLWLLITHHNTGNDSGVFVDTIHQMVVHNKGKTSKWNFRDD